MNLVVACCFLAKIQHQKRFAIYVLRFLHGSDDLSQAYLIDILVCR